MSRKDRDWTVQIQEDDGSWVDVYWCDIRPEAERMAVDYAIKFRKPGRTRLSKYLILDEQQPATGEETRANE